MVSENPLALKVLKRGDDEEEQIFLSRPMPLFNKMIKSFYVSNIFRVVLLSRTR